MASLVFPPYTGYDHFAAAYNRTMAEDFCRRAFPVVGRLLLNRVAAGARVLDVCCGTGQMARELAQRGFDVIGLDASEAMLQLARQNAPRARFFVADARSLALPPTFGAALATFNSLAHASDAAELELIFRNVRQAVVTDAPLLFDLSMDEQYRSRWRGSFASAEDELAMIVRPSYDRLARVARNQVTVFHRCNATPGTWARSDFTIVQKCHKEEEIRQALSRAGFARVDSFDAERDLGMAGEAGRRFFLCS